MVERNAHHPQSRPPSERWRPALVIAIALALQVPLFVFLRGQTEGAGIGAFCATETMSLIHRGLAPTPPGVSLDELTRLCGNHRRVAMNARVFRPPAPVPEKEEPEEEIPDDAQVVEVPEQEDVEKPKEVDTKFVSNKTTRTEKETRSRVAQRSERKAPGNVSVEKPSEVASKESQSPDPTVTTKEQEKELQVADVTNVLPEADRGEAKPETVLERGDKPKILMPATSDAATLANIQALSGDFTTTDHLPDIEDGDSTVLNANRYKYADFFLRVKSAVEKHWKPVDVYRRRDPTGRAYGVKDRYTLLRVTLNDRGEVLRLLTTRNSGLDFMDAEAKSAFERAQPFPNPPDGLVNTKNEVVFEFGFYFEITGGTRFRWRRL